MREQGPTEARATAPRSGYASTLRALLDVPRAVRSGAKVASVLDAIAGAVSEALGFQTVVMNVYRPEWDDFYVAAVHGSDTVRNALLGSVYGPETWRPLLRPEFEFAGAYFIPNHAFDWSQHPGTRFVPEGTPAVEGPRGWHPEDELFVPLERSDGEIVGVMSFGDPIDGLRPDEEKLALAVALAAHASLALETAQEREGLERHQRGLEELLRVSSHLPQTMSTDAMLRSVCAAVRDALDFDKVLVQLVDPKTRLLHAVAAAGWEAGDPAVNATLELSLISRLFDPQFEIAGCYLVPGEEAARRVGRSQLVYESVQNGKGRLAWNHHWLVVPLFGTEGAVQGVIWADEPRSRLLPSDNVLQALRIFGNHAMEALAAARQLAETRFLADHDPLTRLLNRRALFRDLSEACRECSIRRFTLVFFDLDNFKAINDEHGHSVGDTLLERFGSSLVDVVRSGDRAFRLGGDEFALLLLDADEEEARAVVARITAALESNRDPLLRTLTASFGIATGRFEQGPDELLRTADEAMYQAKRAGTQVEVAA